MPAPIMRLAFSGKSGEFILEDVKVVSSEEGKPVVQVQTTAGGLALDTTTLYRIYELVNRSNGDRSSTGMLHGWMLKFVHSEAILSNDGHGLLGTPFGSPVASLGYLVHNGVVFLVFDTYHTNRFRPTSLYIVDMEQFFLCGGSIMPVTFSVTGRIVCEGWLSGVVAYGPDRVETLRRANNRHDIYAALFQGPNDFTSYLELPNTTVGNRSFVAGERLRSPAARGAVHYIGESPFVRNARTTGSRTFTVNFSDLLDP